MDADTRKDAHELILQLTTNQRILKQVLEVTPNMFIDVNDNSQADTSKELVYTLTMVEQLIYNSDEDGQDKSNQTEEEQLKKTWIQRFLKQGGLDKMIQMLSFILDRVKKGTAEKSLT